MEKEINKRLKNFGFSFSLGMAILFVISYFKNFNKMFLIVIIILFLYHLLFAIIFCKALIPTYYLISFITKIIGNFLNVVIFSLIFFIFFTPISFFIRSFKKDQIENFSKNPQWYDVDDNENNPQRVEKLY